MKLTVTFSPCCGGRAFRIVEVYRATPRSSWKPDADARHGAEGRRASRWCRPSLLRFAADAQIQADRRLGRKARGALRAVTASGRIRRWR